MIFSHVSVIIPVYNSANTIVRCINSVLNQTIPVHQIIIIDDGSTDNSVDLIYQLKEKNKITNLFLIQQKNSGPSTARNEGIYIATGDYIAFLDSDDWWIENKIERQLSIFSKDNTIGMVGTKYTIDKPSPDQIFKYKEISFIKLVFNNYFATSTVMIKRELLSKLMLNVEKRYSEDYELWLKIAYNNRVIVCAQKLTVMGKPIISKTGLSSNLFAMEKSELDNLNALKKENKISLPLWAFASLFSILKFLRRWIISRILL